MSNKPSQKSKALTDMVKNGGKGVFNLPITCPKNYGRCGATIEYNPRKLFVLMPFSEEQAPQKLFTGVLEKLPGWLVLRADCDFTKPEIWCKICANIQNSRAVIADLSGSNPNVFLELGLAWGFGKPYILLTQEIDNLPFDTRSFHVIKYVRNNSDVDNSEKIKTDILQVIEALPPQASDHTLSVMPSSDSSIEDALNKDDSIHASETTNEKSRDRKIRAKINDETTFEVDVSDLSAALAAIKEIDEIKKLYELNQIINKLRNICETEDGIIFFPSKNGELTKTRQLTLTIAASFPVGISLEFIDKMLGISRNNTLAYCHSKNNPTSRYLKIKESKVFIDPDGLYWIFELLKREGFIT